jgi:hypothetical protein
LGLCPLRCCVDPVERKGPKIESPSATQPRVVREGQAVTVLYDPAAPQQARIASGCLQYGLPIFFIFFGLALALFATLFGFFSWFLITKLPAI